jgi:ABC-type dipeptide/oligopeptide/nickel transport system permease component
MLRYTVNRLIQLIPTIFGIYTLAFFLMRILPGDPATVLVGFRENQEALDNLRRVMHLDEPVLNQYLAFLQGAITGDLGRSYLTGQPVTSMIADAVGPTVTLAASAMLITSLGTLALLTRMTRSSMVEELNMDYIRTARGKGISQRSVVVRHALRNALLPVVTVWGGSLANLLSGTLLVEVLFSWPGMGRLLVQAINTRDYPLVQALVIFFALIYAGINLLVDLSYPLIDPRIRVQ